MGVWGACQAIAFGLGGVLGTLAVDVAALLPSRFLPKQVRGNAQLVNFDAATTLDTEYRASWCASLRTIIPL